MRPSRVVYIRLMQCNCTEVGSRQTSFSLADKGGLESRLRFGSLPCYLVAHILIRLIVKSGINDSTQGILINQLCIMMLCKGFGFVGACHV